MANERKTDFFIGNLLNNARIKFTPNGSDIKEIQDALKTASKKGTGKNGFPEFVCKSRDFIIVIEDKADLYCACLILTAFMKPTDEIIYDVIWVMNYATDDKLSSEEFGMIEYLIDKIPYKNMKINAEDRELFETEYCKFKVYGLKFPSNNF